MPKQFAAERPDQGRKALRWLLQRPSTLFTVQELLEIYQFERDSNEYPMSILTADLIIAFADEILKMNGGTQKFGTPPWEKA
jgi:hypothetical protein